LLSWTREAGVVADELERRIRVGAPLLAAAIPATFTVAAPTSDPAPSCSPSPRSRCSPTLRSRSARASTAVLQTPPERLRRFRSTATRSSPRRRGAFVADDKTVARKVRYLATQSQEPVRHYEHLEVGFNHRLSNVLAALGSSQLATLEGRVARRRLVHECYVVGLADLEGLHIVDPLRDHDVARGDLPTRRLTCITLDPEVAPVDRDYLIDALEEQGIESRPGWKPMHLQPVHQRAPLFGSGDVATAAFAQGVALPSGSALIDDDIDRVIEAVRASFST
jgi:hypothetical protein